MIVLLAVDSSFGSTSCLSLPAALPISKASGPACGPRGNGGAPSSASGAACWPRPYGGAPSGALCGPRVCGGAPSGPRSEEHTSELQSRENLVCRLLLEKKK